MPDRVEDAAEKVAHERAAGVAHGQRPGGIGADELDVDLPGRSSLAAAVVKPSGADGVECLFDVALLEPDVDEAGAGNLGSVDDLVRGQRRREVRGDVARRPLQVARQLHGQVGREVAMLCCLRPGNFHDLRVYIQRGLCRSTDAALDQVARCLHVRSVAEIRSVTWKGFRVRLANPQRGGRASGSPVGCRSPSGHLPKQRTRRGGNRPG